MSEPFIHEIEIRRALMQYADNGTLADGGFRVEFLRTTNLIPSTACQTYLFDNKFARRIGLVEKQRRNHLQCFIVFTSKGFIRYRDLFPFSVSDDTITHLFATER